jgi:hypothetical protein
MGAYGLCRAMFCMSITTRTVLTGSIRMVLISQGRESAVERGGEEGVKGCIRSQPQSGDHVQKLTSGFPTTVFSWACEDDDAGGGDALGGAVDGGLDEEEDLLMWVCDVYVDET